MSPNPGSRLSTSERNDQVVSAVQALFAEKAPDGHTQKFTSACIYQMVAEQFGISDSSVKKIYFQPEAYSNGDPDRPRIHNSG